MRVAFYTLGCKTNQYETQAMEKLLEQAGYEIGAFAEKNDAYVINTCSVTAIADKKNRAVIRRCRRDNPEAVLGVYSSTVLAFVAAGITAVYQLEQLPKPIAGLIHLAVLYADYLAVYLLNGWIKPQVIAAFSLIFVLGFGTIWGAVYLTARRNVSKMNQHVQRTQK